MDSAKSFLNEATRWSNLSKFASSDLAKLTIAAPFIAFIVLLNEPVRSFLRLTPESPGLTILDLLAAKRFEIFYLGLITVGAAVGLFAILAPRQITSTSDYRDFIKFREETKTVNDVASSLEATIDDFMSGTSREEQSPFFGPSPARFPGNFRSNLFRLVESEFRKLLPDIRSESFPEDGAHFFTGTGYVSIEVVLECLHLRRRFEWNLWGPFYEKVFYVSRDVFQLEYLRVDYSHPRVRTLVFFLLLLGVTVILFPTAITTILVFASLFSEQA